MIAIERKRVKIPRKRARPRLYPFEEMHVGQSFFVPGKKGRDLNGPITNAKARLNRMFTRRTMDGGVRVWRIR